MRISKPSSLQAKRSPPHELPPLRPHPGPSRRFVDLGLLALQGWRGTGHGLVNAFGGLLMNMTEAEARRLRELLLRAASSFEEGISGMNHSFLVENEITLPESQTVHDAIAFAIRCFVADRWSEG